MKMRRVMRLPLSVLLVSGALWVLPAQAQVSDAQVGVLVEALRRAAPQTGTEDDGLYSEWQILPVNISRWSKHCTGRELSTAEFEASPATARSILICTMQNVLGDEYRASGNNEAVAVRRAAAWWMTGNPNRYTNGRTAFYTQKVLSFYQQLRPNPVAQPAPQPSNYDRYMQAGYAAMSQKDYPIALANFQKALSERPGDRYATQAVRNVEGYNKPSPTPASSPGPSLLATQPQSSPSAPSITQEQALNLISEWLRAKQQVFAPPFNHQSIVELTTGELYTDLSKPNGTVAWLKNNNAYYRFGVQKIEAIERFVANGNKATIEARVTEDRTLYRNGIVDPGQTDFETRLIRYSLQLVDGRWKIADYKTADGSLLERVIAK